MADIQTNKPENQNNKMDDKNKGASPESQKPSDASKDKSAPDATKKTA